MVKWAQMKAILWKNWCLLNRPWKRAAVRLAFLVLIIYVLRLARSKLSKTENPAETHKPRSLDSFVGKQIFIPYTPSTPATESIMKKASIYCERRTIPKCTIGGFPTVEDAFKSLLVGPKRMITIPVIQFEIEASSSHVPKNLRFKVLIPQTIITKENFAGDEYKYSLDNPYLGTNVLPALLLVTSCFIIYWSGNDTYNLELETVEMPTLATTVDMIEGIRNQIPLASTAVLVLAGTIIIKLVGEEKQNKLKESMKLMGVTSGMYWLTWTITGFIYFQLPILCFLAGLFYPTENGRILEVTDPGLFHIFMTLASFNTLSFLFVVTCFFNSPKTSSVVFPLLYIVPSFFTNTLEERLKRKFLQFIFRSVFPAAGFIASITTIINGEKTRNGYSFLTLHHTPGVNYEETLLEGLTVLIVNSLFHFFLLWYMDNVFPGEYGVSQPYNFCCTKQYWCPEKEQAVEIEYLAQNEKYFESPPPGMHSGIQMRGLVKVFSKKVAVAGTNFDVLDGQITVLLGHNGAGKTTTLGMITGFLKPTKGTVMVGGHDVFKNPAAARVGLGLCPQHDILYAFLTCTEHIKFYCWLTGAKTTPQEIDTLLTTVGLVQKKTTYAKWLSGGQRRKLSVACAVVGGSKVLVLDEPSSGLDPGARRELWDFLLKMKTDRTILMTTHYMDEAEILGDRIAIMHEGIIKCCGTPMFLKNIYRTGYTLSIVKTMDCNESKVTETMKKSVPHAMLKGSTNTEMYFHLPETYLPKFGMLFKVLEDNLAGLHIESFGLTATSMEDVFIKVGQGFEPRTDATDVIYLQPNSEVQGNVSIEEANNEASEASKGTNLNANYNAREEMNTETSLDFVENYTPNSGFKRLQQQMRAIVYKKAILTKRKWLFTFINAIVIPLVLVFVGLRVDSKEDSMGIHPALTYSLQPFKEVTKVAYYSNISNVAFMDFYRKQVQPPHEFIIVPTDKYASMNLYLLKTGSSMKIDAYVHKMIVGAEIQTSDNGVRGLAYYQTKTHHGIGISTQMILNAFVKFRLGDKYSVETGIDSAYRQSKSAVEQKKSRKIMLPFMIVVSMAILPSVFIHSLIAEREIGAYHLQRMCGLHPFTYWLPTYFWDMSVYSVTMIIILIVCITSPKLLLSDGKWAMTLVVLTSYGLAMLPNCYVLQRVFSTPAGGVSTVILINIIVGVVVGSIMSVLAVFLEDSTNFRIINLTISALNPPYNLINIIMRFIMTALFTPKIDFDAFMKDKIVIYAMIIMWVQPFGNFLLLFLSEFMIDRKIWYAIGAKQEYDDIGKSLGIREPENKRIEDNDVVNENSRILTTPLEELIKTDVIILRNLCKIYNGKVAVNRTCVGIPQRECFGLLGQNGAGKTSTFKMLTGDIMASGGDALLLGNSIRGDLKKVQVHMGYCPQFDSLHNDLTGQETLYLYGRLKGVPEEHLLEQSNVLHSVLNITKYAHEQTKNYRSLPDVWLVDILFFLIVSATATIHRFLASFSNPGGTKRKLSIAISLLGKTDFIYLDEPTCGMDPVSRRNLWKVFHQIRASGRTMILTSHSMEECEALCTKIVIMTAGSYQCLGSLQHLKSKFSQGFLLMMKLKHPDPLAPLDTNAVIQHTQKVLEGAQAMDVQPNYIRFKIPETNLKLSYIFEEMEKTKALFDLDNYAVAQTSLEQVFIALSSSAIPQATAKRNPCI